METNRKMIAGLVMSALIGIGAVVVGGKDIVTAAKIAFDKEAAAAYCVVLLEGDVE